MVQIDYKKLSEKLPAEAIEKTSGRDTGKGYDTTGYGYQYVVNRLNEVIGVENWIITPKILRDEVITTAKGAQWYEVGMELTIAIGKWRYGVFVTQAERTCYGGHQSKIWGDAAKGAFTNALKKTAALFGIGKEAYEGTIDDDSTPIPTEDIEKHSPKVGENIKKYLGGVEIEQVGEQEELLEEMATGKQKWKIQQEAARTGTKIDMKIVNKMTSREANELIQELLKKPSVIRREDESHL